MTPYYDQDGITIYHGDCRDIHDWVTADVLVTDPPYGQNWSSKADGKGGFRDHEGIAGDKDTTTRDGALSLWGDRPAVVFGSMMLPPPTGCRQVLVYKKPPDAGTYGTIGFRRDLEAIYLVGPWKTSMGGRSSIVGTGARSAGNPSAPAGRTGHPHTKPVDLMTELVDLMPGSIADPFMGSGSTLVAAKQLGRTAIGVEVDERYCETAAKRLSQGVLELFANV